MSRCSSRRPFSFSAIRARRSRTRERSWPPAPTGLTVEEEVELRKEEEVEEDGMEGNLGGTARGTPPSRWSLKVSTLCSIRSSWLAWRASRPMRCWSWE